MSCRDGPGVARKNNLSKATVGFAIMYPASRCGAATADPDEYEEEKRIFYVTITRAKKPSEKVIKDIRRATRQ